MSFKMESSELPMLVPPRPWSSVTEGGYLVTPCKRMTCRQTMLSDPCST